MAAPSAFAHGGSRSTGYVSTFAATVPNVLGVSANVSGPENLMRVTNYSGKTVVVFGVSGEPYLRFTRAAVYENKASPTTYLNASRPVPAFAAHRSKPRWTQVARGPSYTWHEHRIVWTGSQPPASVRDEPDKAHLIFNWRIPAAAAGTRFRLTGFLGWVPPARGAGDGGTSPWLIAGVVAGGLLVAAGVGLGARRVVRRAP